MKRSWNNISKAIWSYDESDAIESIEVVASEDGAVVRIVVHNDNGRHALKLETSGWTSCAEEIEQIDVTTLSSR